MKTFRVLMVALLVIVCGLSIGSFFHWLYWNAMILASKMVFGVLFMIPVVIILGLLYFLFRKSDKT
jgi:hypothetical protein